MDAGSLLVEAFLAVVLNNAPENLDWRLTAPSYSREGDHLVWRGALPSTMHFGSSELDLATGELRFVDEDHRDGADTVVYTMRLAEPTLERMRALADPP